MKTGVCGEKSEERVVGTGEWIARFVWLYDTLASSLSRPAGAVKCE